MLPTILTITVGKLHKQVKRPTLNLTESYRNIQCVTDCCIATQWEDQFWPYDELELPDWTTLQWKKEDCSNESCFSFLPVVVLPGEEKELRWLLRKKSVWCCGYYSPGIPGALPFMWALFEQECYSKFCRVHPLVEILFLKGQVWDLVACNGKRAYCIVNVNLQSPIWARIFLTPAVMSG